MKKIIAIILALALLLTLAGCGSDSTPETESTIAGTQNTEKQILGEGAVSFQLNVVDLDGTETCYEIHTDASTVGVALQELGLIEGYEGDYGLYITSVCGIVADWETDGTYWAFYVDGEYGLTGIDFAEINTESVYSLVRTNG